MPEETKKVFLNVFSRLKQRVIWKWETEEMEGLPPNVMLKKWLPQQDILGHKNIKLFITHGGLLSTQEAIYHGVPLIGEETNVWKSDKQRSHKLTFIDNFKRIFRLPNFLRPGFEYETSRKRWIMSNVGNFRHNGRTTGICDS
jgi:hypothetical protein